MVLLLLINIRAQFHSYTISDSNLPFKWTHTKYKMLYSKTLITNQLFDRLIVNNQKSNLACTEHREKI